MNKDLEQLRWLSIGFYVNAAIMLVFACFPFIHLFIGIAIVSGTMDDGKNPPPAFFGWFFIVLASVFIVVGFALAVCNFLAGKFLKQHRNHTFCFVLSCVNCLFAPLGTVLGVFAIIVLVRDSVKALFNGGGYNSPQFNGSPDWQ